MSPRHEVAVQVTFESEHNFYAGSAVDLGGGGLFVATNKIRPIGECVRVHLTLPTSSDPIDAIAEVRWLRTKALPDGGGEVGMGLMFLQLSPKGKAAVKAFLKRRESIVIDTG